MCEPTTVAIGLAAGAKIAGGVIQGNAIRRSAEANAAQEEFNAKVSDIAAGDALQRGAQSAENVKIRGGRAAAAGQAAFAAGGVRADTGSALDVFADTTMMTELDAQIVQNNAAREAMGYRNQAKNFRNRAQYARDEGDAQADAAVLGGIVSGGQQLIPLMKVG